MGETLSDLKNQIHIVYLEVDVDDGVNLCKSGTMAGFAKVVVTLIGQIGLLSN